MKRLVATLSIGLLLSLSPGLAQQTDTKDTNPTQDKDVPKEKPGNDNPDIAPQYHQTPATKPKARRKHAQQKPAGHGGTDNGTEGRTTGPTS
jgi:hypothetical protein